MARRMIVNEIAEKYQRNASASVEDYVAGAQNPRREQKAASIAGEAAFASAMTRVLSENLRLKGVERQDERAWIDGIVSKGRARYAEGVRASRDKYATGMAPYLELIQRIMDELPPRGPRGSAANLERVRFMNEQLHELKVALEG